MAVVAVTIAGRTSLAGGEIDLLLLAGGQRWCAAMCLNTGALVSAVWDEPIAGLRPFVVAKARVADDQSDADPVRPEEVALIRPPRLIGRTNGHRAERMLRPLLHPPSEHILGIVGSAAQYWTLDGSHPSVALVAPSQAPVIAGSHCRFRWRHLDHRLPLLPQAREAVPRHPRTMVVTLSAPRQGYCYKVVAALL